MIEFLTAPFPFERNPRVELIGILLVGIFIALFLIVFQPFGTFEFQSPYKKVFLLGYGVIVSLVILLFRFVIPFFLPRFFDEASWTVGKHILWSFLAFSVAITACYFYWGWFFKEDLSVVGWWDFTQLALTVAIFPISGIILYDYISRLKRYQQGAANLNPELEDRQTDKSLEVRIRLRGEQEQEVLTLWPSELLFIHAANNYVEIFYRIEEKKEVKKLLFRNSLKNMEDQIEDLSIVRCHRSYIVNLDLVKGISGNAQGYQLHLSGTNQEVPVSRSRSEEILGRLRKLET